MVVGVAIVLGNEVDIGVVVGVAIVLGNEVDIGVVVGVAKLLGIMVGLGCGGRGSETVRDNGRTRVWG